MAEDKGRQQGRLVAVVVTYNRLAQLQTTLARLLDSAPRDLAAVVVVDNASTDDTAAWLATQNDPRLDVLRSATNVGGAGGFAAGMARAMEHHAPDWLVVMDDDGRPQADALATFQSLDLTGRDGLAAAVYYPSGAICDMNRPSRNPFWHLPVLLRTAMRLGRRDGFHVSPAHYDTDQPIPIDITSFVGFFVRAAAVRAQGYPDPALFIYGDDGLYTLGLRQAGHRIDFDPRVRFDHDCSTFEGQRGRFRPLWKAYYYHRNLLTLYRRAAGWLFVPLLFVVVPKWLFKVRNHDGSRGLYLRLLGRAVWDGLRDRRDMSHADVRSLSGD